MNKTGKFIDHYNHLTDTYLRDALIFFYNQLPYTPSIYDFGCGDASYSKALVQSNPDIDVAAYDGNPLTPELTGGFGGVLDLASNLQLSKRDWVICFEVGEHVPKKYESILLDNLFHHADKGVILSWATPGQGGNDHVNEQENSYIISEARSRGFDINSSYTKAFRAGISPTPEKKKDKNASRLAGKLYWFKNTIMIFEK